MLPPGGVDRFIAKFKKNQKRIGVTEKEEQLYSSMQDMSIVRKQVQDMKKQLVKEMQKSYSKQLEKMKKEIQQQLKEEIEQQSRKELEQKKKEEIAQQLQRKEKDDDIKNLKNEIEKICQENKKRKEKHQKEKKKAKQRMRKREEEIMKVMMNRFLAAEWIRILPDEAMQLQQLSNSAKDIAFGGYGLGTS